MAARTQWRRIADQRRPKLSNLAVFLDEAETDVLAYVSFPAAHRAKLHSANPLERVNGEIKQRTEVVDIFPNEDATLTGRRHPARTERRFGRPARTLHDPGNRRAVGR